MDRNWGKICFTPFSVSSWNSSFSSAFYLRKMEIQRVDTSEDTTYPGTCLLSLPAPTSPICFLHRCRRARLLIRLLPTLVRNWNKIIIKMEIKRVETRDGQSPFRNGSFGYATRSDQRAVRWRLTRNGSGGDGGGEDYRMADTIKGRAKIQKTKGNVLHYRSIVVK